MSSQAVFATLSNALNDELIEREEEVAIIQHALLSRTHVAFVGGPGTGKSMSIIRTFERIDGARTFHDLVFRASPPETFLGPVSIPALQQERFKRAVEGYIPACDLVSVEELFNASTTLLQSLYLLIQERKHRNDGKTEDVPLSSFFCSSNVLPQQEHEELAPLWDRFHTRKIVHDVSPAGLRQLLALEIEPNPKPILTWDEILKAQAEVRDVVFTDECADALHEIALSLRKAQINPTPRRLRQIQDISRAAAWLDEESKTQLTHLEPLVHSLWEDPEQLSTVEGIVYAVCSPDHAEVLQLSNDIVPLIDELTEISALDPKDDAVSTRGAGLSKKTARAAKEVQALRKKVNGRAARKLDDVWRRLEQIHTQTLTMAFGLKQVPTLEKWLEDQK